MLVRGGLMMALMLSGDLVVARGKPAPSAPPNPDIVYMSSSSNAPSKPAIRGVAVTVTGGTVTSTETQLSKPLDGRSHVSVVWSPDGSRFAWIEGRDVPTAKIMWARPGGAPSVLYEPGDVYDPHVWGGSDVLAWSNACSGVGSVLVFARAAKWDPVFEVYTEVPAIMGIDIEPASPGSSTPPAHGSPRVIRVEPDPNGFALTPSGSHLVFNSGYGENEKVSVVSMCTPSAPATTLLTWADFAAARYAYACSDDPLSTCPCNGNTANVCYTYPSPTVHSIDWSDDQRRLALSVTVGPDPWYDWRDLRVAYLEWDADTQAFATDRVERIDLDAVLGPASSEHSPQWGSGPANGDCERLAFSQSAGANDGSTMNGRRLYLYDLVTISTACLDGLREIPARDPRAIDWK
jgi:hypothetical protein